MLLKRTSITGISLDAAGLVALADVPTIVERTALTGSASLLDTFFLAPGIHTQQNAGKVNGGELPTTAAMTTGYVFRIENQATVYYLQKVGEPGSLVTLQVESIPSSSKGLALLTADFWLYSIGISLTAATLSVLATIGDYWAFGVLLMLAFARLLNVIVIIRRSQLQWKGAREPGVKGDLLVLLSQDRWVRIQGMVDDLKAVTSGQWLRDQTSGESFASACATLLVYLSAAVASNASTVGSLFIASLLLISTALLGLCNNLTGDLRMFGRRVHVVGKPKKYRRRIDMGQELVKEIGSDDWAIALGLVLPPQGTKPVKVTP